MNIKATEKKIINKYLGIPYIDGGRCLEKGVDCYGLIIEVCKDLGKTIPDVYDFEGKGDQDYFDNNFDRILSDFLTCWVEVETPKVFDVVLIHSRPPTPKHAGMVLTENRILHSAVSAGVVVSCIDRPGYNKCKKQFYRLNNE